ncbi:MAG: flavodoxin family protein [Peptococcaceae bacterium]|nr:flavodoxin family protein [Peptococcaceae bacterium]
MLLVAINGSPRKNGNTAQVLRVALSEAQSMGVDTLLLYAWEGVSSAKQPFCIHCSTPCQKTCFQGTKLEEMFNVLCTADAVILGSPVYFATVSGPLKAFWDKTRSLRKDLALLNVVGGCIAVGGSRFGGQETTVRAMHDMMLTQGMTVVGDGDLTGDAGHQGVCAQQPAEQDQEVYQRTRILVRRVVDVARVTSELRRKNRSRSH